MNTKNALTAITSNINVGMNEVVSVFVAKYEDGLFAKKEAISASIRDAKAHLASIDSHLIKSVNAKDYEASVPNLGLIFKMGDVGVCWNDTYHTSANMLFVEVNMYDTAGKPNGVLYMRRQRIAIDPAIINDHKEAEERLKQLNDELLEVMALIKTVSRKERQIRGRISELKLAESGFSDIINNTELLQLVKLD